MEKTSVGDYNLVNLEYKSVERVNGLKFPIEKCSVNVSKTERTSSNEPRKTPVFFNNILGGERQAGIRPKYINIQSM